MSVIVAKQLVKTYVAGDIKVEAIRAVDFTIEPASFVSFIGPSFRQWQVNTVKYDWLPSSLSDF